jgi:hypothetical protein
MTTLRERIYGIDTTTQEVVEVEDTLPTQQPNSRKPDTVWRRLFTAMFSIAFLLLFTCACIGLNLIDNKFGATTEGSVMPSGIKLLQLILYGIGIHSGAVVTCNLVNWTSSSFRTYWYENPMVLTKFDLDDDLNTPEDLAAKARLAWHSKRFYTFYFVSVGIILGILSLKMYLQVN